MGRIGMSRGLNMNKIDMFGISKGRVVFQLEKMDQVFCPTVLGRKAKARAI